MRYLSVAWFLVLCWSSACTGDLEKQADANGQAIANETTRAQGVDQTVQADLADALQRIADLESELAALDTTVAGLASRTAAVETATADNATNIAGNATDIAANAADVAANLSAAQANTARLHARHDELLFVWDANGQYLGRLFDYGKAFFENTPVVRFVDASTGYLVTAVTEPATQAYFTGFGCSGSLQARYLTGNIEDASPLAGAVAILDQSDGRVFVRTGAVGGGGAPVLSYGDLLTGACTAVSGSNSIPGPTFEFSYSLPSFSGPIVIAPMVWQ